MQAFDLALERGMQDALELPPRDIDAALDTLQRSLALCRVRRCLLHDDLDGRTARALCDLALELQGRRPPSDRPGPPAVRRWLLGR